MSSPTFKRLRLLEPSEDHDVDFEIRLSREQYRDSVTYTTCVFYVGSDPVIERLIQVSVKCRRGNCGKDRDATYDEPIDPKSYCLFYGILSCYKMPKRKSFENLTRTLKFDGWMPSFYNMAYMLNIADLYPFTKLKGLGHSLVCMMIQEAVKNKDLTLNSWIAGEASGAIGDKAMTIGLINYYKTFGLEVMFPDQVEYNIANKLSVPMRAEVKHMLEKCTTARKHPLHLKISFQSNPIPDNNFM